MIKVSISEFKKNFKKYIKLAQNQDLAITKYGEIVFIIESPKKIKDEAFDSIIGVAQNAPDYDVILENKINEL